MTLLVIVLAIMVLFVVTMIEALLWWGLGAFIVWVFAIPIVWTFWHGLATGIIVTIITCILKNIFQD